MRKSTSTLFNVRAEYEVQALEHLRQRGYLPDKVERTEDGVTQFVFLPLPDNKMYRLAQALPFHLSTKIGIVVGNGPPFLPEEESGH